jgi:hypothetical protein
VNRFWEKVVKGPECWEWTAGKQYSGYGRFWLDGKKVGAHRHSWALENGPIPEGMHVLHRCDNPGCCNPAHLFLGTHADNVADMASKGRQQRGESNGKAKLTELEVRVLRRYLATDISVRALARHMGVNESTLHNIKHNRKWRHLS